MQPISENGQKNEGHDQDGHDEDKLGHRAHGELKPWLRQIRRAKAHLLKVS
jgi:hypothetical protein